MICGFKQQGLDWVDHLVIGGGLSGLAAAYRASQAGQHVRLIEASERVGGCIQTLAHEGGWLLEAGPHTFPSTALALNALCQAVGCLPQPTQAAAHKRYVAHKGKLVAVPGSLWQGLTTPLLSVKAKAYLLAEPFRARFDARQNPDPAISEWVAHRLGPEVLARFVAPFLSGVYAGDPAQLGIGSVLPGLLELEQTHGSLVRGMINRQLEKIAPKSAQKTLKTDVKTAQKKPKYALLGFANGMQTLTDALANALPAKTMMLGQGAAIITPVAQNESYCVQLESGESIRARQLTLAVPAFETARLLAQCMPTEALEPLSSIPYAAVGVVHVRVPVAALQHALDGFGFLVPKSENTPLLGCIWASALYPNRAPQGQALLSCFVGGVNHPEVNSNTDAALMALILPALAQYLKAPETAFECLRVVRWSRAIPQYSPGHRHRVQQLNQALVAAHPNIALVGNYLHGIALNACVQA
ncbi:MAG: protoporphyrinogen oxidase [Vampirovibrionales bacterium]|nr:protoporphyrinogen oxidase [Vampirovibrionales bacterium]